MYSTRRRQRSRIPAGLAASASSRFRRSLGGVNTRTYASQKAVKVGKSEWVGRRKKNTGLLCSFCLSPSRKGFPLRATARAVSLMTSRSSAGSPGGTRTV